MWNVVTMTMLAGLLGGAGNFLLGVQADPTAGAQPPQQVDRRRRSIDALTAFVMGVIAALLVPLFLSMASSDLLSKASSGAEGSATSLFVYFGFCLVAAVFSRRFVDTVAERAFRLAGEAKHTAEQTAKDVQEVTGTIEEPESGRASGLRALGADGAAADPLLLVLDSLESNPRYKRRTPTGIMRDANLPREVVEQTLNSLLDAGLVERTLSVDGDRQLWRITPLGKARLRDARAS